MREELRGTFFTMDLDRARAASLQRVPWVRSVACGGSGRNRLEVTVEEHAPLARWNDNALVNTDGEVFTADYDGDLPQFTGPDGPRGRSRARAIAEFGDDARAAAGSHIGEHALSPRGGWQLQGRRTARR